MAAPFPTLASIRAGGKAAVARALALVETAEADDRLAALLDEAAADPRGLVLGLTGPPGVGKSTLTGALIQAARRQGRMVAVIAVDPSSQFTGGALLGDRTRLRTDPEDSGIFVRSMAARDRLGGLSDHAVAVIVLMRACYDLVIVESVGVGQSEGDIADVSDLVLLLIQPGSGDSLQFMKAGIMELPDLVAVTKADMGEAARRAAADVEGALTLSARGEGADAVGVHLVSATTGQGFDGLSDAIEMRFAKLKADGGISSRRRDQAVRWVRDRIRLRFGSEGLATIDVDRAMSRAGGAFRAIADLSHELRRRLLT